MCFSWSKTSYPESALLLPVQRLTGKQPPTKTAIAPYFSGLDDLLHQAFDQYAQQCIDRFAERMARTTTADEACDAIVEHIMGDDLLGSQRDLNINLEFYTLAARNHDYRDISERWMAASRAQIERHFDASTAMLLDAMIEGITLHRALGGVPGDLTVVRDGIRRIAQV